MPSEKAATVIRESASRLFGDLVSVRYIDVGDTKSQETYKAAMADLDIDALSLPVILIDDELLSAGSVNPLRTIGAIAAALKRNGDLLPQTADPS